MKNLFIVLIIWAFSTCVFGATKSASPAAATFANPFDSSTYGVTGFNKQDTEKLAQLMENRTKMLNEYQFSDELRKELWDTWQVLNEAKITFSPLAATESKDVVAVASAFPDGYAASETVFRGLIQLSPAHLESKEFLFSFLHEVRHLRDIQLAWRNRSRIKMLDSEQNAYRLHSLLALETKTKSLKIPVFAESKWLSLGFADRDARVSKAVAEFLKNNKFYSAMAKSKENDIDFSSTKLYLSTNSDETPMHLNDWTEGYLPPVNSTPGNLSQTIKNRRQSEVKLVPSPGSKSPLELLKTALANELVIRQNLNDFAIEIKTSLECFEKKEVKQTSLIEHLTPLSTGQFVFAKAEAKGAKFACSDSVKSREFDIANIFWTHKNPELENSYFMGNQTINGRLTAVYNFRPTANVVSERVFIGTFYVDVEDAQIVKFYGEVQNRQSAKSASLNNLVTIWRRKSSDGIWLTSSVKSRGLLPDKQTPFAYEMEFSYKMTDSEIKILDDKDGVTAGN